MYRLAYGAPSMSMLFCSSGDCSSSDDPLHGLTGDLGDEIEVVVVVQHHEPGRLGGGRDQQVGDLGSSVLTPFGRRVLHGNGAVKYVLVHRHEGAHRHPDEEIVL